MLLQIVIHILAASAGIMIGSIPAILVLSGGEATIDRKLCAAIILLYFAAVTWGMVELLARLA